MRFGVVISLLLISGIGICQEPLLVQRTYYQMDENTGKEIPSSQTFFQYDNKGRERVNSYSTWIDKEQRWGIRNKYEREYNAQGQEIWQLQTNFRNGGDTIEGTFLRTYAYNSANQLAETVWTESYYNNSTTWQTIIRYGYSTNGCLASLTLQTLLNGVAGVETRVEYTTDEHCHNVLVRTSYSDTGYSPEFDTYEYENNNLVAQRKYSVIANDTLLTYEYICSYNTANQRVTEVWGSSAKNEYEYDAQGNNTVIRSYQWDATAQTWAAGGETNLTYNSSGQILVNDYQSLGFSMRTEYEYNELGKATRILFRFAYEFSGIQEFITESLISYRCDGEESETISKSMEGGVLKIRARSESDYLLPAACEPLVPQVIEVYPNPTTSTVRILFIEPLNAYQIRVFNSVGQLIKSYSSEQGLLPPELDFTSLPSGLYTLQVTGESFNASSKLLKQ